MRRTFGICCLALGICCLLSSVGFLMYIHLDGNRAANISEQILSDLQEKLIEKTYGTRADGTNIPETALDEAILPNEPAAEEIRIIENTIINIPKEMPTIQVDGYDCIGVLSIPVLELELPVLTDWSYEKFKLAPCLYYGSYYEPDFVIAAHNYQSHFGKLSQLQQGDLILFTDISGTVHCYEVILLETLPGLATAEMITSGFDLSLYTCTASGSNRTTVRCQAVENQG